jgi:AcrR family transcriptional regulator
MGGQKNFMENLSKREAGKARKKALFIEAAEKLFLHNGFENTSIDEVAKAAGMTKRTLYQYFVSKEDLFYAVTLAGGRMLAEAYVQAFDKGTTALEKIRLGNEAYLKFYTENPDLFRLLNYRPANQKNADASPHFNEIALLDALRMRHFIGLIDQARADGSINPELDMKKAVFFSFFSAFSLLYTVSTSDKGVWDMMGVDQDDFLVFGFDLLSKALK